MSQISLLLPRVSEVWKNVRSFFLADVGVFERNPGNINDGGKQFKNLTKSQGTVGKVSNKMCISEI